MRWKKHDKLVRDKIPEIIKQRGDSPVTKVLSVTEFRLELRRKLLEEAREVVDADTVQKLTDELADVLEVIESIAKAHGIRLPILHARKETKRAERGSFEKRLLLQSVGYKNKSAAS